MNSIALVSKIDEKGFKKSYLADKLGISYKSFYNKINGNNVFTISEASTLMKELSLSKEEAFDIFLGNLSNEVEQ